MERRHLDRLLGPRVASGLGEWRMSKRADGGDGERRGLRQCVSMLLPCVRSATGCKRGMPACELATKLLPASFVADSTTPACCLIRDAGSMAAKAVAGHGETGVRDRAIRRQQRHGGMRRGRASFYCSA